MPRPAPPPSTHRFAPGTLLASRYRIVSRLGKGGMGEVFRADDLVLGQSVALKFLPENARGNQNLLTRFYEEVRITREISHANVCRVYDIGEAEGQPFLSMEYIDGEDLGSLLRRIGRLPADKAGEIARKLCAGLGAAHAKGVLHRDLKPGNIMIDGRGEVRITDFGLATVAEQLQGPEVLHGTPAYMSPEQLAGHEVTARSDLYALGLVLYEVFTGKRAHQADSPAELLRMRETSQLTSPSSVIKDLDPGVERAILRCLDPDPKQRPASALDLARALPGGDPLAAALAAGETPSPEMVADSGSKEALRPAVAVALLAAFGLCIATYFVALSRGGVVDQLTLDLPPEALAAKAREIASSLGYTDRPADSVWGFTNQTDYLSFLEKSVSGPSRIDSWREALAAAPSPVVYWYRQAPAPIVPVDVRGFVEWENPVSDQPGAVDMALDIDGRLREFNAVPPQRQEQAASPMPPSAPDWTRLFAAARLDIAAFTPTEPLWTPLAATDVRAAWTGTYPRPGGDGIPIRVEAAAFRGKPVYFQIVWPWTEPDRERAPTPALAVGVVLLFVALFAAAIVMVRHNWRIGRGDVRGATRLAGFVGMVVLLRDVLWAHHVGSLAEVGVVARMLADATSFSVVVWLFYVALEPWVRRYWPQSLIVWSRALAGRWRDPVLGRDVLIGMVVGVGIDWGAAWFRLVTVDRGSGLPFLGELSGLRVHAARAFDATGVSVLAALVVFLILFFARVALRNQWLAALVPAGLLAVGSAGDTPEPVVTLAVNFLGFAAVTVLLMRFGLVVAVAALVSAFVLFDTTTSSFTLWYGQGSFLSVLVLGAVAVWAFRTSLGSRKLGG
jgi:serine/threonine-protein kinase